MSSSFRGGTPDTGRIDPQDLDEYLELDRRAMGERIAEIVRWLFIVVLVVLNNLSDLSPMADRGLVNLLLLTWALANFGITLALVRGFRPQRWFSFSTAALDIAAGSSIVYFSSGLSSPYFLALFVAIIAGSVRFGTFAGLVTALIVALVYLSVGGVSAPHLPTISDLRLEVTGRIFLFMIAGLIAGLTTREMLRERRLAVQRAAQAETLRQVVVTIAQSLDVDHVERAILERALELTGAVHGRVVVAAAEGYQESLSLSSPDARAEPHPLQLEAVRLAADLKQPVLTFGGRIMVVPFVAESTLQGLLQLEAASPVGFSPEQRFLAGILAETTAATFTASRLSLQQARELEVLHERAQRLGRLEKTKSEFLSLVSHELRRPLTILNLYSDFGSGELPSDLDRRSIDAIGQALQEINLLTDHLLEVARLEDGSLELKREIVDLKEVLSRALDRVRPLARPSHRFQRWEPPGPISVSADRHRLEVVIVNLLSNAIKYSPHGGEIGARLETDRETVHLSVSDQGIGIAQKDLPLLFQRFGRLASSADAGIPGTGLGLFLARDLAHRLGGEIDVVSTLGQGSTFTLSLPLVQAPAPPPEATAV